MASKIADAAVPPKVFVTSSAVGRLFLFHVSRMPNYFLVVFIAT